MISKIALNRFDRIWKLFDRTMFELRGSMFLIEPFEQFFTIDFAKSLTEESAKSEFHRKLNRWGQIERVEHIPDMRIETLSDGTEIRFSEFSNPELKWSRTFILSSFYNLCCLGSHHVTIEELIFEAIQYRNEIPATNSSRIAFLNLVGISKSFLLAEWGQDIIRRAISNDDEELFKKLSRWINEDTTKKRFNTAKSWLATTLLWYLGGKDLHPRNEFMTLLQQRGLLSSHMSEDSFRGMLSLLGLLKNLTDSK